MSGQFYGNLAPLWDVLDRDTGEYLGRVVARDPQAYIDAESEHGTRVVLENRSTREVIYGAGFKVAS